MGSALYVIFWSLVRKLLTMHLSSPLMCFKFILTVRPKILFLNINFSSTVYDLSERRTGITLRNG